MARSAFEQNWSRVWCHSMWGRGRSFSDTEQVSSLENLSLEIPPTPNLADCFWVKKRAADREQWTPISWNWQEPIKCVKISHVLCGQLQLSKLSEGTGVRASWDGSKPGAELSWMWPLTCGHWTAQIRSHGLKQQLQKYLSVLKGSQSPTLGSDETAFNTPECLRPLRRPWCLYPGFPFHYPEMCPSATSPPDLKQRPEQMPVALVLLLPECR